MQEKDLSDYGKIEFRGCYLHPEKPAARKCTRCMKPTCFSCSNEYKGKWYCPACLEAVKAWHEARGSSKKRVKEKKSREPATARGRVPGRSTGTGSVLPIPPASAGRSRALDVSQVTVEAKGQPGSGRPAPPPLTKAPLSSYPEPPPTIADLPRQASGPGMTTGDNARPEGRVPTKTKGPQAVKRPSRQVADASAISSRQHAVSRPRTARPAARRKERGSLRIKIANVFDRDKFRQAVSSLPYGIIAGIVAFGFWLVFTFIRRQWIQISVLTAGIAIGWALFSGSTAKRQLGRKVWRKPLPPIWAGVTSVVVLGILFPAAEYLAFMAVSPEPISSWGEFVARYFRALDWLLIVSGFVLAFAVPYFLNLGVRTKRVKAAREEKGGGNPEASPDRATPGEELPS